MSFTCSCDSNQQFMSAAAIVHALQISTGTDHAADHQNAKISIDEFDGLLSESNHDHLTEAIVAALGGIDKILNEYIRVTREHENEELLNGSEMQNIANIIAAAPTAPTESIYDRLYERAKFMDNTYHFNSCDTMWHWLLADQQIADRIVTVMFSKFTWTIIGIAYIIFTVFAAFPQSSAAVAVMLMMQSIIVLFLALAIFSCNIPSLLLILTTFDFWIKVGYSLAAGITSCILFKRPVFYLGTVQSVLLIANIALIDGHHGKWKVAFIFGLLMSCWYSWFAVEFTFNISGYEEQELQMFGMSINLNEWMGSCARVLSLFLWKQTLMAAYTRGKWCICIYISPYIKWIDEQQSV